MKKITNNMFVLAMVSAIMLIALPAHAGWGKSNPCNPCGKEMKNPCNPCNKKNVCNPCNPCNKKMKSNPCDKMSKNYAAMVKKGKKLWNDKKLGKSGMSCMSCHTDHESLNLDKVDTFPHYVAMPDKVVTLDQMINFCMITPMETDPLPWDSVKMTAIASYYQEYIKSYKGVKNACNPCNMKKNSCNPCNPCNKRNPCNPCGK